MTTPLGHFNMFAGRAYTWRGTDLVCMARLQGKDSSNNLVNLTQTDISSITYVVADAADGSTVTSGNLTISSVVFNSLQTSSVWTEDSTGFNFLATLAASTCFPAASKIYLATFTFTLETGTIFKVVFENVTRDTTTGDEP